MIWSDCHVWVVRGVKLRFDKRCGFFSCRRNEAQILVWRHLLFSSRCLDHDANSTCDHIWSQNTPENRCPLMLFYTCRTGSESNEWAVFYSFFFLSFFFFGFCPSFFFCLLFLSVFKNVVRIEVITNFSTHHTPALTQTGDPQPQGMNPDHRTIRTTRVSMCCLTEGRQIVNIG